MPDGADDIHKAIRKWLKENISYNVANEIRILFGGLILKENANEYIGKDNIDGLFVGDSQNQFVKSDEFKDIVHIVNDPNYGKMEEGKGVENVSEVNPFKR